MRLTCFCLLCLVIAGAAVAQNYQRYFIYQGNLSNGLERYFAKTVRANYPESAYIFHKKGSGEYNITINPESGAVTQVKVVKSTGVKVLDDSAAVALLQWKAKPHLLDHATIHFEFRGPGEHTGSHISW